MLARMKQMLKAIKYQRQIRAAISTQLSLLDGDGAFALGGLTEEEEQYVGSLVRECAKAFAGRPAPGPIVEFGTLFGLTTRLIADEAAGKLPVITVDNFSWNPFGLTPAWHEAFARKILRKELEEGRVSISVSDSAAFRTRDDGATPSMVFLDADHSYEAVRDEIAWAKRLGVPFICGHDYGNAKFGVTRAVDEAFPEGVRTGGMVWCWCDRRVAR